MVYLRSRYYAPESGRFLTRDAWAGDFEYPSTLHRWVYVEGNPVNETDPTGYCPGCPWDFKVRASDAWAPDLRDDRLRAFQNEMWNYKGVFGGDVWDVLGREADFVEYLQDSARLGIDKPGNWYDVADGYLTASRFAGLRLASYLKTQLGCGNIYLGQLEPGVAEWAAFILVAENGRISSQLAQIFGNLSGVSNRFTLSTILNIGFWSAHNAALREGVRRADAQGLRSNEPDPEQLFTNFMLFNVLEPGDQCAMGKLAFCSFTIPYALQIGSDLIYPQHYPATWDDIEKIAKLFVPIYGAWNLLGANPPGDAHHLVTVPRPDQWCKDNPLALICLVGWK